MLCMRLACVVLLHHPLTSHTREEMELVPAKEYGESLFWLTLPSLFIFTRMELYQLRDTQTLTPCYSLLHWTNEVKKVRVFSPFV